MEFQWAEVESKIEGIHIKVGQTLCKLQWRGEAGQWQDIPIKFIDRPNDPTFRVNKGST